MKLPLMQGIQCTVSSLVWVFFLSDGVQRLTKKILRFFFLSFIFLGRERAADYTG